VGSFAELCKPICRRQKREGASCLPTHPQSEGRGSVKGVHDTLQKRKVAGGRESRDSQLLMELKTESGRRMVGEIKREENRDSQLQTEAAK
jgi:hypothetical protein